MSLISHYGDSTKTLHPQTRLGQQHTTGKIGRWKLPRAHSENSMAFSELKRASKAVAGMVRIDHSRDPHDHTKAKRRWGAAKGVLSSIHDMDYQASITDATSRAAGGMCGGAPPGATQHWGHITCAFSEEDMRQHGITGERNRRHAPKRWAFTDTLGLKAAVKNQERLAAQAQQGRNSPFQSPYFSTQGSSAWQHHHHQQRGPPCLMSTQQSEDIDWPREQPQEYSYHHDGDQEVILPAILNSASFEAPC